MLPPESEPAPVQAQRSAARPRAERPARKLPLLCRCLSFIYLCLSQSSFWNKKAIQLLEIGFPKRPSGRTSYFWSYSMSRRSLSGRLETPNKEEQRNRRQRQPGNDTEAIHEG